MPAIFSSYVIILLGLIPFPLKSVLFPYLFIPDSALYFLPDKMHMVQFPRNHFSSFLLKQNKHNIVFTTKYVFPYFWALSYNLDLWKLMSINKWNNRKILFFLLVHFINMCIVFSFNISLLVCFHFIAIKISKIIKKLSMLGMYSF